MEERNLKIIKVLIEEYMKSGDAVSSQSIANNSEIHLSSASIRNILVKLEEQELIKQDHASAGRKPTPKGIRIYLNSIIRMHKPNAKIKTELKEKLLSESTNVMAKSALDLVSKITGMVSFVTLPGTIDTVISNIKFVRLSSSRVMAVLITNEGEVRNRIIQIDKDLNSAELENAARVFNERFSGHTLATSKLELKGTMLSLEKSIVDLLQQMLSKLTKDADVQEDRKFYVSGEENLYMNSQLITQADKLNDLMKLLNHKKVLFELIDKGSKANDVSVFIGSESGIPELNDFSLVTSPYDVKEGNVLGALGVIGPIRMKYAKILPIMEITSSLMNDAVKNISKEFNSVLHE